MFRFASVFYKILVDSKTQRSARKETIHDAGVCTRLGEASHRACHETTDLVVPHPFRGRPSVVNRRAVEGAASTEEDSGRRRGDG